MKVIKGEIVNLTGDHPINIIGSNGQWISIPPSGKTCRLVDSDEPELDCMIDILGQEIPLMSRAPGRVVGLPDARPGVYYLCSTLISAVTRREDVICPSTMSKADKVTDADGKIVAVRSLSRYCR